MNLFAIFYISFPVLLICYCIAAQQNYSNVATGKPNMGSGSVMLSSSSFVYDVEVNDGETKTCDFMMDSYLGYVWWIVDLENQYEVSAVNIYKQDNYISHYPFEKFYVYVSTENPFFSFPFPSNRLDDFPGDLCLYRETEIPGLEWNYLPCNQSVTGRFVTWFMPNFSGYLYLCEFEVLSSEQLAAPAYVALERNVATDVQTGVRSISTPFYSTILDRPYPINCVVTCLTTTPNIYSGRSQLAQLDKTSGMCQCVIIGSFEFNVHFTLVPTGSNWFAMWIDTNKL